MVEALADLQAQAPQRDVVRNVRIARRSEQDGVHPAQPVEPIVRHHHAVPAIPVPAPIENSELEAESASSLRQRLQDLLPRRHDFLADAVAGDGGDPVELHPVLLV